MNHSRKLALPEASFHSLNLLAEGNRRFLEQKLLFESNICTDRLREVAEKGQTPFCIVLTCSDSRIPVEAIFDAGFGDIFVIRVAGNVISSDIIASIEFAAEQFNTPLCLVMGHTGCGAVTAAVDFVQNGECSLSHHGLQLLHKIAPSVHDAMRHNESQAGQPRPDPTLLSRSILRNMNRSKSALIENSSSLRSRMENRQFFVAGALFDLHSGVVTFDEDSLLPRQHPSLTVS